jgi:hypothetical protein
MTIRHSSIKIRNLHIQNLTDNFLKDEINLTTSDINKATNDLHSVIQQVADLTLRKKSKNKKTFQHKN